jgi:hypothetical protein
MASYRAIYAPEDAMNAEQAGLVSPVVSSAA